MDGLHRNLTPTKNSECCSPNSPNRSRISTNSGEPTAPGSDEKDNRSSSQESSDQTLQELTFDDTSTSEEIIKPTEVQKIIAVQPPKQSKNPCEVRCTPSSRNQFKPLDLGMDYLTFRENVFYGLVDSSNENTNLISGKSGTVDLARPQCACFPFIKYWNWGKHKNQ